MPAFIPPDAHPLRAGADQNESRRVFDN